MALPVRTLPGLTIARTRECCSSWMPLGRRPAIDQIAERVAANGYVVLAPNVFYRAGRLPVPDLSDSEARASFFQSIRPLMDELVPERVASDGGAYLDCLADLAQPGPVGITGYAWADASRGGSRWPTRIGSRRSP